MRRDGYSHNSRIEERRLVETLTVASEQSYEVVEAWAACHREITLGQAISGLDRGGLLLA